MMNSTLVNDKPRTIIAHLIQQKESDTYTIGPPGPNSATLCTEPRYIYSGKL
jgi:hypothetical protein